MQSSDPVVQSSFFSNLTGFVAGSAGGCAGVLAGHPFDTIRVRLQVNPNNKGFFPTFLRTIQREKVFGLYKGLLSPLLGEMANNMILFGVFDVLDDWSSKYQSNDAESVLVDCAVIAGCGGIAGLCMSLIVSPTELVKIQLQTNTDSYGKERAGKRGFMDCTTHILRERGAGALYHGYSTTFTRELFFNAIYFVTYEMCKRYFAAQRDIPVDQLSAAVPLLISGGAAGTIAWGITYPIDYLKSSVQADFSKTMSSVYRSSTWRQMYRGLTVTLVRAAPVNAITFYVFQTVHDWMKAGR